MNPYPLVDKQSYSRPGVAYTHCIHVNQDGMDKFGHAHGHAHGHDFLAGEVDVDDLFKELVEMQRKRVKKIALQLIPHLTDDDLLQPNDFPLLENHPFFRYEEGVLEGIMTAHAAYLAHKRETSL